MGHVYKSGFKVVSFQVFGEVHFHTTWEPCVLCCSLFTNAGLRPGFHRVLWNQSLDLASQVFCVTVLFWGLLPSVQKPGALVSLLFPTIAVTACIRAKQLVDRGRETNNRDLPCTLGVSLIVVRKTSPPRSFRNMPPPLLQLCNCIGLRLEGARTVKPLRVPLSLTLRRPFSHFLDRKRGFHLEFHTHAPYGFWCV